MNRSLLKKVASAGSVGLTALALIALGIAILVIPAGTAWAIQMTLGIIIMLNGVLDIVSTLRGKYAHSKWFSVLMGLLYIVLGVFFIRHPHLLLAMVPNLFGIYLLINSLTRFITCFIFLKEHVHGALWQFITAMLTLVFAAILFLVGTANVGAITIPIGIYCLILGAFNISDFVRRLLPQKAKTSIKRHFRVSIPVVLAAFMPKFAFDAVDEDIIKNGGDSLNVSKSDEPPDLEVFVHSGKSGPAAFGHVDLYFDGMLYSYGSYDSASQRMWAAMGDGVLFTLPDKQKYIDFSLKEMNKTMFCFGLRLSEEQKQNVRKCVDGILTTVYVWDPVAKKKAETDEDDPQAITDYASRLWRATGASFYKFKEGIFKSYFVMSTNCVLLADRVIGSAGTDIISLNGIITPGAYYDYLNRELQFENSRVISRTVYYKKKRKRKHSKKAERRAAS